MTAIKTFAYEKKPTVNAKKSTIPFLYTFLLAFQNLQDKQVKQKHIKTHLQLPHHRTFLIPPISGPSNMSGIVQGSLSSGRSSSDSLASEPKIVRPTRGSGSTGRVSMDWTGGGGKWGGGAGREVLCGDALLLWIGEPDWLTSGEIGGGGNGGT